MPDSQGQSSGEAIMSAGSITFIALATVSFLLLLVGVVGFLSWRLPNSSSEQDAADGGVFLMVCLPSPYEPTLTRIARAASTSSSRGLMPPCLRIETGGVDEEDGMRLEDKNKD